MNEVQVQQVLACHDRWIAIFAAAFFVWRWLPWWIAAMRAAIHHDDAEMARARKALKAIKPRQRRIRWRRHRRRED